MICKFLGQFLMADIVIPLFVEPVRPDEAQEGSDLGFKPAQLQAGEVKSQSANLLFC